MNVLRKNSGNKTVLLFLKFDLGCFMNTTYIEFMLLLFSIIANSMCYAGVFICFKINFSPSQILNTYHLFYINCNIIITNYEISLH